MATITEMNAAEVNAEMEENRNHIRKMVLDSYEDMLDGKGRDYKEFFGELESRYRNANV